MPENKGIPEGAGALSGSVQAWFNRADEVSARRRQAIEGLGAEESRLLRRLRPASRVLDIGCAAGKTALALAAEGHRVAGIDVAERLVAAAQSLAAERGLDARFATCGPAEVPDAPVQFDAALLFKVYCYVPRRERRRRWLRDIARVVRPGGLLLVSQYIIDTSVGGYGPVVEELGQRFPELAGDLEEGDGFTLPCEDDPTVSFVHHFMERDLLDELRSSPFTLVESWRDELMCYCALER